MAITFFVKEHAHSHAGAVVIMALGIVRRVPDLYRKFHRRGGFGLPDLPPLPFEDGSFFRSRVLHVLRRPELRLHPGTLSLQLINRPLLRPQTTTRRENGREPYFPPRRALRILNRPLKRPTNRVLFPPAGTNHYDPATGHQTLKRSDLHILPSRSKSRVRIGKNRLF